MLGRLRQPATAARKAPALAIEVVPADGRYRLSRGGEHLGAVEERGLVAEIEKLIFEELVPGTPHFLAFHAALLKKFGQSVLFPAPSGSGKTTLSAALTKRGWSYGSDEMALLNRDLMWRGLPLPPCVKSGNYRLVEGWHPALGDAPEHDRYGRKVKYLPVAVEAFFEPVDTVVFPRFDPGAETRLEPVDPFEGLIKLLGLCVYVPLGFGNDDVERLLRWHESVKYYALSFRDPMEAAALLEKDLDGRPKPC